MITTEFDKQKWNSHWLQERYGKDLFYIYVLGDELITAGETWNVTLAPQPLPKWVIMA